MARIARADVGPLAEFADGYREKLARRGHTPGGVVEKLVEVGRLSDWMTANGLCAEDLTAGRMGEFSAFCAGGDRRPIGPRTLRPLVEYLRALGVVPDETVGATALDILIDRYRCWLVGERALAARTVGRYVAGARQFLESRAGSGSCVSLTRFGGRVGYAAMPSPRR